MKSINCVYVALLLLGAFGCGKSDPTPSGSQSDVSIIESLSPAERVKYCMVYTSEDTSAAKSAFFDTVKGFWVHYPTQEESASDPGLQRREFRYDPGAGLAAVTFYYGWYNNIEDIAFKKACLSKPLDPSYGALAGYRILQLMAANNEGGAAILIKLETPKLYVSDRVYDRWASGTLRTLEKFMGLSELRTIRGYSDRH